MLRPARCRIAALVLAGAGAASVSARPADLPDVTKRGTLRVLVMPDTRRPEFFSLAPGAPPGFDHEVLQGFAALHDVTLKPVKVASWDALIPALVEGKGDLIAGRFTATDSRRKLVDFTAEVFPTRLVVFTRKPHPPVHALEQLRTEKVGTTKGTNMVEAIAAAGVPAANVDDGIPAGGFAEALRAGRITAAVWGVESAIASQRQDPALEVGMFLGPPASLAYAVRKGDRALLAALDEYIENLRKTTSWSRLVVKYFGEAAPEILKKARREEAGANP
jgi:ABC-type amino acid transport substrate-binding protein